MGSYPLLANIPSFTYDDHLMHNQYVADINLGLTKVSQDIVTGQAISSNMITNSLQENTDYLAKRICSDINYLKEDLNFGLEKVSRGIESMQADFNIGMGLVIEQFEMQREEIRKGLDSIINILENKRKIDAQEHLRDAIEFYNNGCKFIDKPQWFEDAMRHFSASINHYERNPIAHLCIAHIYHYHHKFKNLDKAKYHYTLYYTYGEANEVDYPTAAKGYFYAGWIEAVTSNNLEIAINLTKKAIELDQKFSEGYYHIAKYYSLQSKPNLAINFLKKCITEFDRGYTKKALEDADFVNINKELIYLLEDLRIAKKTEFEKILNQTIKIINLLDGLRTKESSTLLVEYNSIISKKSMAQLGYQSGEYYKLLDSISLCKNIISQSNNILLRRQQEIEREITLNVVRTSDIRSRHSAFPIDKQINSICNTIDSDENKINCLISKKAIEAYDEAHQLRLEINKSLAKVNFLKTEREGILKKRQEEDKRLLEAKEQREARNKILGSGLLGAMEVVVYAIWPGLIVGFIVDLITEVSWGVVLGSFMAAGAVIGFFYGIIKGDL